VPWWPCGGAVVVRWWCGGGTVVVLWWCSKGSNRIDYSHPEQNTYVPNDTTVSRYVFCAFV